MRPTTEGDDPARFISRRMRTVPASGIRKFFDLLSTIDDVISLMTSAWLSGVHAIVFSKGGACVSLTFLSPPARGDTRKIPVPARTNAIWRPSGDHAGASSATPFLVSGTSASPSTCLTKMSPLRSKAT